jgi:aminocarboxymuconate-semialdehyde decarboxylase
MTTNPKSLRAPTVDTHAHFAPQRAIDAADKGHAWHGITFSRGADGKLISAVGKKTAPLAWEVPFETARQRLASLDARAIDIQMVSLTPTMYWHELDAENGRSLARDVNDELVELVAEGAGRYIGLGFLPLQDTVGAVAELERAMRDLGFAGVVVASHVQGTDWDSETLFPILEAAAALDAFALIHPANGRANPFLGKYYLRNFVGNPLETTVAAASMIFGGVIDRLPNLKVGLSHAGGYAALAIGRMDHGHQVRPEARQASRLPSDLLKTFYLDSIAHSELALRHVIDEIGIDRILLGSDYPADMGEPYPVKFVESCANLSAEEKRRILSGNVQRVIDPKHFAAWSTVAAAG